MTDRPRFPASDLLAAVDLAAEVHDRQPRKGGDVPYVSHLFLTAAIAMEYGATLDETRAALLHDAIEDAEDDDPDRRHARIRDAFPGTDVYPIVAGCTDAEIAPKPPWGERKRAYIDHLRVAPSGVLLVAAADKVANVGSLLRDLRRADDPEQVWGRFKTGSEDQLWYYRSVCEVLAARAAPGSGLAALVAELEHQVDRLAVEVGLGTA